MKSYTADSADVLFNTRYKDNNQKDIRSSVDINLADKYGRVQAYKNIHHWCVDRAEASLIILHG